MGQERTSLGFDDALDDFNPNEWKPSNEKKVVARPEPEATEKAAKVSGFKSREAQPVKPEKGQGDVRRRRTGRNAQFNLKAKPETIEAYCEVADQQGWGLGETLEKAVELLEQKYRS